MTRGQGHQSIQIVSCPSKQSIHTRTLTNLVTLELKRVPPLDTHTY